MDYDKALETVSILVAALGAGLAVWGIINLVEAYKSERPKEQKAAMKQLLAGGDLTIIAPLLRSVDTFPLAVEMTAYLRCRRAATAINQ